MSTVIKVENLSKLYRLGNIGTGTLSHDLNRWAARFRGKEDPYLKLGETNARDSKGNSPFVWALKDINFELQQGEVLGIVGKNGAGKSTLLKILSRTTLPSKGCYKIKGKIASLLEVGTGFHPELTGRENVFLNGAILGMQKAQIRKNFDEIVAFSGVERYIDTPVKRYSSGMYVRLAFAVAAHLETDILIVDEVLAVGDQEFQDKCIGKMKAVSSGGKTVIFVSHNMGAVKSLCTKGLLIDKGVNMYDGTATEAIIRYSTMNQDLMRGTTLAERKDRKGMGIIQVEKMWIENGMSHEVSSLQAGEKYSIKLKTRRKQSDYVNAVYAALIFRNHAGERMFTLSSDMIQKKHVLDGEHDVLVFQIDKMPLSIGKYYIDYILWEGSDIQDTIEGAYEFSVSTNDFFGTGVAQGAQIDLFFSNFDFYGIKG